MNKSNSIVVYESKYGTTEKYAKWISKHLECDLFKIKDLEMDKLKNYDNIIYGGGLYAGGVLGIKGLIKYVDIIRDKNIILFTCGLSDPNNEENIKHIKESINKVISMEMQQQIKVFHLRGGIDYSRLSITHKIMMSMLYKKVSSKEERLLTNEDKEMISTYGKVVDFTNKESILPIVDYIESLK